MTYAGLLLDNWHIYLRKQYGVTIWTFTEQNSFFIKVKSFKKIPAFFCSWFMSILLNSTCNTIIPHHNYYNTRVTTTITLSHSSSHLPSHLHGWFCILGQSSAMLGRRGSTFPMLFKDFEGRPDSWHICRTLNQFCINIQMTKLLRYLYLQDLHFKEGSRLLNFTAGTWGYLR